MIAMLKDWGRMPYPWPLWLMPFLLICPAVFCIPSDVFIQYPWSKTYTDWVAQWIPMINRAAHLNSNPDKFRAFFAYSWSWLPLFPFFAYFEGKDKRIEFMRANVNSPKLFLSIALTLAGVAMFWYAPGDRMIDDSLLKPYNIRAGLYNNMLSWLWLSPVQTYGAAIALVGCVRLIHIGVNTIPHNTLPIVTPSSPSKYKE